MAEILNQQQILDLRSQAYYKIEDLSRLEILDTKNAPKTSNGLAMTISDVLADMDRLHGVIAGLSMAAGVWGNNEVRLPSGRDTKFRVLPKSSLIKEVGATLAYGLVRGTVRRLAQYV